ncbi:MAG: transporter substrate-binding domain-containing protein [Clostridia bacterium]|nr:transporter substrate-binding domain-containing protein [Clostridia bacterium]
MKKIIAVLLSIAMLLCFAGCAAKKTESKSKAETLTIINEELGAEQYGIAFRNGDDETCKYIDAAVQELVKNGKYKEIADKYPDIVDNLLFLNGESKATFDETVDVKKAEKRTFTMGIDPEYNPFSYMGDNGEYTGFDVEICKAACEVLGWEFKVFGVNWDQKLVQLDAKECDCVWSGMTILDSMTEAGYVISAPYYYNTQVLVVKTDGGIKSSKDLKDKVVAVQLGTSGESLLNEDLKDLKDTFKELVTCDSFLKCFTELEGNAVDAVFVDYPVAKAYVAGK